MTILRQINLDDLHYPSGPIEAGFVKLARGTVALDAIGQAVQAVPDMPASAQPFVTAQEETGHLYATWAGGNLTIVSNGGAGDAGILINWLLVY